MSAFIIGEYPVHLHKFPENASFIVLSFISLSELSKLTPEIINAIKNGWVGHVFDNYDISRVQPLKDNPISKVFENIAAPLSFYRSVIKQKSKDLGILQDESIFDLLMDLSFSNYESPTKDIETKISELDNYSDNFLNYLNSASMDQQALLNHFQPIFDY